MGDYGMNQNRSVLIRRFSGGGKGNEDYGSIERKFGRVGFFVLPSLKRAAAAASARGSNGKEASDGFFLLYSPIDIVSHD